MYNNKASKSKIIATIGPASGSKNFLKKMIVEGVDVCRLNFSHGTHPDHERVVHAIRELNEELGTEVAILADLQGPKLRIGKVQDNAVHLENGKHIQIVSQECVGTSERVYLSYTPLALDVVPGEPILVDDGKIKLEVVETNRKDTVTARVVSGGVLSSNKGVNLPNTRISLPSLTEKDLKDADFVLDLDVDWLALSFVRSARDVHQLRKVIKKKGRHTRVVAKIEKPEALRDIDAIIQASDAIMVARGDLGVEIPFDQVPVIQKQLVQKCILNGKAVIIATQMMESMISNFRPSRAEATDVANAVVEGADALMLSGETSVGHYPIESIISMQKVINSTEGRGFEVDNEYEPDPGHPFYLSEAVCYNACKMADLTGAKGIVVFTYSGGAAFQIAKNRPRASIFAFSPDKKVIHQLSMLWGVHAFFLETKAAINEVIEQSTRTLKNDGFVQTGDVLVYVAGLPMGARGPINTTKIETID